MYERGNTIEFKKDFYKRIQIAARIEGKTIAQFAIDTLDEKMTEIEQNFAQTVISKNKDLDKLEDNNS